LRMAWLNDKIDNLLSKLWRERRHIWHRHARQLHGRIRVAQTVEKLITSVANVFADLDVVPAVPLVLLANTVSRGNPAVLRRPNFLPFVAFLSSDFQDKVHRFAGAGASAHDEVGIVGFLLALFVRIRNAEV